MESQSGGGQQTGTPDTTYNLTAVLYHALQGVENCKTYSQDAQGGEQQLRQFFEQAAQQQQQLAEQAKRLLHDCLMQEMQGGESGGQGSAFSFGQQDSGNAVRQPVSAGSTGMGSQQEQMVSGQSGGASSF